MTGIDTNVLLRYLVAEDDRQQAKQAASFVAACRTSGENIAVSCVVLCELAWVLRRALGLRRPEILDLLERVLNADIFQIEEEESVRRAVQLSRQGKGDFADYLIGQLYYNRGCRVTVTFDRALRSDPAFSVL